MKEVAKRRYASYSIQARCMAQPPNVTQFTTCSLSSSLGPDPTWVFYISRRQECHPDKKREATKRYCACACVVCACIRSTLLLVHVSLQESSVGLFRRVGVFQSYDFDCTRWNYKPYMPSQLAMDPPCKLAVSCIAQSPDKAHKNTPHANMFPSENGIDHIITIVNLPITLLTRC